MQFQVLGSVRVTHEGGELPLGGPQQRLVLALLIAARGRSVPVSRLILDVWGEEEPPTAKKALQGYIHHLRAQVGDVLVTEPNGYALVTTDALDAARFEELAASALQLAAVDAAGAADVCREALAQWSGVAYSGVPDSHGLISEIAHLDSLRIRVLGDRLDADLALGRHNSVVGELQGLSQEFPLQERFRAQLMLALYRAGRQVEALRVYERVRRFLGDEMGLEPSAELMEMEAKVLARDTALDLPDTDAGQKVDTARGYELRERVLENHRGSTYRGYHRSVGREVMVTILNEDIADDPEFIAEYLSHSKRVAALEHPHIGFVFDTWREPGRAYQVSRWLSGGNLREALTGGPMALTTASRTIDEIGGALAQAHRHDIAHGAVSSEAIRFDETGHGYLMDFSVGARTGAASIEADRVEFAALVYEMLTARRPRSNGLGYLPEASAGTIEGAVLDVLRVALDPNVGYSRIEDFTRALRQAGGIDVVQVSADTQPRSEVRNPYKGLMAFQETDADDFHGRADLTAKLTAALQTQRLVAVVGPSGSGKSSVVKAGLTREIREGDDGRLALVSEMYPGAYPFEELESALIRVSVNQAKIMEDLVGDDRGLLRVLKQILPDDSSQMVLIIDQFEELFSMVSSEATRQLFLDNLVNAIEDPRSRLRVVVTMRADFFDRPLQHPAFGRLVEAGLVPVTVMDGDDLAQAIAAPAGAVGVDFEPGLVAQISKDVGDQPGALPLLQYALTELFDQRKTNTITLADYQARGGIFGALGRRAEETFSGLDEISQRALRHALLRLVSVDDGSDDLRLRVRRADLSAEGIDEKSLGEVLQVFGAHRLLTFDLDAITRGATVEVAHEALLREWPRLAGWIDEQRDDLVVRRRLAAAMAEWRDANKDSSFLPTGSRLAQFEEWTSVSTLELAPAERQFLQSAVERERRKELSARNRRRGAFISAMLVAAVLAVVAGFAIVQRSNASDAAFDAETSRLAATAINVTETFPEVGLLVAAEAHDRAATTETLGSLQRTLLKTSNLSRILDVGFNSSGISASGTLLALETDNLAASANDGKFSQGPIIDLSVSPGVLIDPPIEPINTRWPNCAQFRGCPGVFNSWIDFEPGGADLLVQFVDAVLHVYRDHDFAQPMITIPNVSPTYASSPTGKYMTYSRFCSTMEDFDALVSIRGCGWVGFDVVDLETGEVVFTQDDDVWARVLSWSSDGGQLYRISGDDAVTAWDTSTWTQIGFIGENVSDVSAINVPIGADYIAVTDLEGTISLLDSETGDELDRIHGLLDTQFPEAVFSADGAFLLSVVGGTARMYDVQTAQQIGAPFPHDRPVSPRTQSGEVISLATDVGELIHVWNLDTSTWFDTACDAAGRNMTRNEWEQFGPRDTDYRATCPQFPIDS